MSHKNGILKLLCLEEGRNVARVVLVCRVRIMGTGAVVPQILWTSVSSKGISASDRGEEEQRCRALNEVATYQSKDVSSCPLSEGSREGPPVLLRPKEAVNDAERSFRGIRPSRGGVRVVGQVDR